MATTDKGEWILLDTDLTTRLGILPVSESHLYFELSEPGSGELKIPLDSAAASQIASGMFCECYYRGSSRGGFFVDNIRETQADASEGEGRWLSVSGRGALALLDDAIIWSDGTGVSNREFTSATKASILIDLILEAQTRGGLSALTYDFTDTDDSASVPWTDSESFQFAVGTSLLDIMRQFARTGIEFEINLSAGSFVLSAYKNGLGTDKSETIFFRIGTNCIDVGSDERGDEIDNALLVKFKDGYAQVSDSTSITNRRRREKLLNIEQAQSSDSATTYAAALLDNSKDPLLSISVKVFDGVSPLLFLDYDLGDTVTLDMLGTEVEYRVLGIQSDFNGDEYSNVTLELNNIIYENELKTRNDLDWLMNQWVTAHDANLMEVKTWMSFGAPNGAVNALFINNGYLYVGGAFTLIANRAMAEHIARYKFSTGAWEAMDTGIPDAVTCIAEYDDDIYAASAKKVYKWDELLDTWSLVGTATGVSDDITCMIESEDGSVLHVGGYFTEIGTLPAVAGPYAVVSWNGATWEATYTAVLRPLAKCYGLTLFQGKIYGGFSKIGGAAEQVCLQSHVVGVGWAYPLLTPINGGTIVTAIHGTNDYLYWMSYEGKSFNWDGVVASEIEMVDFGADMNRKAIGSYLSDIYFSTTYAGAPSNGITKYSGGNWGALGTGLTGGNVLAITSNNADIFAGGTFTNADGKPIPYLAVWITSWQSLVDLLAQNGDFDLGAAIHGATVGSLTDDDEFPFWEDVSKALRKITWVSIKSTLKTWLDTLYGLLDAANTWTMQQSITPSLSGEGGIYINTIGDAYTADFEQGTENDNVSPSTPALLLYQYSTGAGNIPSAMIDGFKWASSTGTVDGDYVWFGLYVPGGPNVLKFRITKDGTIICAPYERHIQLDAKADGTVGNQPTQVDFFKAGGMQYPTTGSKFGFCQWEIPDDWNGTDVYFEIDWMPDSGAMSGTDTIEWQVEYRAVAEGERINNGTSVTVTLTDSSDYSQYQTKHSRFTLTYNNANQPLTKQDHVYFKITRNTGVANDFGGSVTVTAYEIIYMSTGLPTSN